MIAIEHSALSAFTGRRSYRYSLDAALWESIPAGGSLEFIIVKGKFSYSGDSKIIHGDVLAVTDAEFCGSGENLWVLRIGDAYYIRRRKAVEHIARRMRIHAVGTSAREVEVVGLVVSVFRPNMAFFSMDSFVT